MLKVGSSSPRKCKHIIFIFLLDRALELIYTKNVQKTKNWADGATTLGSYPNPKTKYVSWLLFIHLGPIYFPCASTNIFQFEIRRIQVFHGVDVVAVLMSLKFNNLKLYLIHDAETKKTTSSSLFLPKKQVTTCI